VIQISFTDEAGHTDEYRLVPLFPAMNCREANQSWEGTLKNNIPEWRRILRAEKSPYETNRSEQTFDESTRSNS